MNVTLPGNVWYYTSEGVEARTMSPGKFVIYAKTAIPGGSIVIDVDWTLRFKDASVEDEDELTGDVELTVPRVYYASPGGYPILYARQDTEQIWQADKWCSLTPEIVADIVKGNVHCYKLAEPFIGQRDFGTQGVRPQSYSFVFFMIREVTIGGVTKTGIAAYPCTTSDFADIDSKTKVEYEVRVGYRGMILSPRHVIIGEEQAIEDFQLRPGSIGRGRRSKYTRVNKRPYNYNLQAFLLASVPLETDLSPTLTPTLTDWSKRSRLLI
jgi:hypothetical protein